MQMQIIQENSNGSREVIEERDISFVSSRELDREKTIDRIFLALQIVGFICQLTSIICFFIVVINT